MLKSIKMLKVIGYKDKKISQDIETHNIISQIIQYGLFHMTIEDRH